MSAILFTGEVPVPGGVPGRGGSAPGGGLGGVCSQGGAWWRPPGTATAAGGTHPTGMHSCFMLLFTLMNLKSKCIFLFAESVTDK